MKIGPTPKRLLPSELRLNCGLTYLPSKHPSLVSCCIDYGLLRKFLAKMQKGLCSLEDSMETTME